MAKTVPEVKEKFLLIETGYEGIQNLCWLSEDKDEILKKREEFIDKKIEDKKELNKLLLEDTPDYPIREPYPRQHYADFFCVQKWDGKKFSCVCNELEVNPSKLMLR